MANCVAHVVIVVKTTLGHSVLAARLGSFCNAGEWGLSTDCHSVTASLPSQPDGEAVKMQSSPVVMWVRACLSVMDRLDCDISILQ